MVKTKIVHVSIETHGELKQLAKEEGRKLSFLADRAIRNYVRDQAKSPTLTNAPEITQDAIQ